MAQYENLEGWEKLSLGMQLDKWAIRYGNRIAVTDSEEEITYSELNQKAIGTGQYFMEKGIQKGDKVLVQLPNRISFVVVLFALAKIGAVPIMMLPAHRETELEGIIALAKPSAYIVAEDYSERYEEKGKESKSRKTGYHNGKRYAEAISFNRCAVRLLGRKRG